MSQKLTFDLILSEMNIKSTSNLLSINIIGKNINDISILSQIPSLEIILLNNNEINNLSVFKNLKNIKKLSLKGNKINDFSQIEFLRYCPKLEYLKLKDNPIAKEKNYIFKIIELLPKLKILDDIDLNRIKNKEKIVTQTDSKKFEEINNENNKYIKLKPSKIKNTFNLLKPNNTFKVSPIKQTNIIINNNINPKNNNEFSENINQKSIKTQNNNFSEKEKLNKENNQNIQNNEEDNFEIININAEKKKMEKENKKYQKIEPKPKLEISNYSFKKKSLGSFDRGMKNIDSSSNLNNNFFNTFNEWKKNLYYNFSTTKYNKKIITKNSQHNNTLSQSFRCDDNDGDENYNTIGIYSKKNKLGSLKNRLLNNLTNKIYNKSKNNNIINNKETEKEKEKEKTIIKSIKLLLTNLDQDGLMEINNELLNIIENKSNK